MAEEYKKGKVPEIVREFDNTGNKYEINGIDQSKCKFFWRKENEKFQIINSGSYRITQEGGTYYLLIEDDEILTNATQFQICYFFEQQSSAYVDKFPELSVAVRKINDLVEDVKNIFSYLKSTGVTGDTSTMSKVLSELEEQSVWWLNNGRIESLPITEMYSKFDRLVEQLRQEVLKLLEQDLEVAERELLEEVKRQLDEYVETDLKQRLDDYTTQLEERLQTMIDQAVADKGLMPEGSDWLEIGLGNWLVVDLFNKNYIHYPPQLNSSDNAGVVKKDITDGGRTQVIRYYTTTGKMFFAVRVNEVWSEWQEVGGQSDSMQFTQANHGFVFTAVTLDGATRKWTKANKYTGADGIAVKVDNDRFDVVIRGVVNIPANARDDKGNAYVYDEYYFLSQDVNGGLTIDKPVIGTFQSLIHVSELDGKQVAYVDVQNPVSLDYTVLDSDTADMIGIGTYKTTLRTADTIADLKGLDLKVGDIVELLGYYTAGDGADHKRVIASTDDGSGVQLDNGLYANISHNGEIKITWLGITKDTLADDNKTIINKIISKIATLKKLILDTNFNCYGIEITKALEITGVTGEKENINITNKDNSKNTMVFKTGSGDVYLSNFLISGGLNGIYSEELNFNPKLDNIYCRNCALAGINHTPNEKYNQSGYSNSFVFSYMKNIRMSYNKYGILIDHSKVPSRTSWSNANSIEYSRISLNEVGIYIIGMDRMECWKISDSDLSNQNVGYNNPNITIDEYKNKLSTNKYGAIILENCRGCDIELNSNYIEYAGDICTVGENSNIGNEIKSKGTSIYSGTYEYQDIIYIELGNANNAIFSKNREYAMFNLINCASTKITCSNCWLEYCNDVLKTTGENSSNGFVMLGCNNLYANYPYIDKVRGMFNTGKDLELLSISPSTVMSKQTQSNNYVLPYYTPNFCEIKGNRISDIWSNSSNALIDISNFDNDKRLFNFLSGSNCYINIIGKCNVPDNSKGFTFDRNGDVFLIGDASNRPTFVFDTNKGVMKFTSRTGSILFRRVTFKCVGSGTVSFDLKSVDYQDCNFDLTEFTGTLAFSGGFQKFSGCSFSGGSFNVYVRCILENLDTSDFFWNDYRTTIPEKITSYPQGHGFNLNGVDYVRKGSQWVRASDGTTQALSEVMVLNTPYYAYKMEQEGVLADFYVYMDEQTAYQKQLEAEEQAKYEAYELLLKENPNLTWEEFKTQYSNNSVISLEERIQEPVIPESVKKFMEKYL